MSGTPWNSKEIGVAITLYAEMLELERKGIPYSKAEYARRGAELTSRSANSMEYKFQNISAILSQIDLPFINGYKPRVNYQGALKVEVLERLKLM